MKFSKRKRNTNKLKDSNSPYLLQHADNPVNWFPWGEEAFKIAEKENKLVLVSIGYAACHWCHVMAHESFEDEKIADFMNKHFINIKVDREERPDVDKIYMEAVHLMRGQGGWPLNCFALPDKRPVFGGTYFRPEQWQNVLEQLTLGYTREPERFTHAAEQVSKGISKFDDFGTETAQDIDFKKELKAGIQAWKNYFDPDYGGENGSPKFPMPANYLFLIKYNFYETDKKIETHIFKTLDSMAKGGIYDAVGGGFARYSTDRKWLVPHFEKMLYDNAQLISLYSKAFLQKPQDLYKNAVFETCNFLEREMQSPQGGFYSSFDADSEGEEGKFYVWTKQEIEETLGKDATWFCELYDVSEQGNWEGKNILHQAEKPESICKKYSFSPDEFESKIRNAKKLLFRIREKRVKPGLDDKIICSWNALCLRAYCDAYESFGETRFLETARQTAAFIQNNFIQKNGKLKRVTKDGKTSISAFGDDYAHLIGALLRLYQITFEEKYLRDARKLHDVYTKYFWDKKTGFYFFTSSESETIVSRKREISDNVIPSANSVSAENLFLLGVYYADTGMQEMLKNMCRKIASKIKDKPIYFANWSNLILNFINPPYEIAIASDKPTEIKTELMPDYRPDFIFGGTNRQSKIPFLQNRFKTEKTAVYICKNHSCLYPLEDIATAKSLLKKRI